jgi:hypothetical protein
MKWFIINSTMLLGSLATAGCSLLAPKEPLDPNINFAAHTVSRGLVIDKIEGGESGVLEPSTTPREGPQFVLRTPAGAVAGALWTNGSVTTVRRGVDASAPAVGTVDASWVDGAIRLRLTPDGKAAFSLSEFKRVSGGASPAAVGRPADSLMDLRGMYLSQVTDNAGKALGWMRVGVDARWQPGHVYTAVLPAEIDGLLAVAAVAQVDAVLDAVEDSAVNPYIGN